MTDPTPPIPVPSSESTQSTDSGHSRWRGPPPDPLAGTGLYRGVMWRRIFAYMADVVILAAILTGA